MAEIIRALGEDEVQSYMPILELLPHQQQQVYEAVGNRLIEWYELTGDLPDDGDFLLRVGEGSDETYYAAFSYAVYNSPTEVDTF